LLGVVAVAIVYFVAARLGLSMASLAEQVSPVWPPTGIALATLLLLGRGFWPGVTLGALAANAMTSAPLATACGIAVGNTLEAIVGAALLERVGFRTSLERVRDVAALIVCAALASTTLSATIGVASLCLGGVQPWAAFGPLWSVWWIGDLMGALVVAPALLVWARIEPMGWSVRRRLEAVVLVAATVAITLIAFAGRQSGSTTRYPLQYAILPVIVWGALRFRQTGATMLTFLLSSMAIASTLAGTGPFAASATNEGLILLQLFLAVVAVTGLFLGAAMSERNAAERRHAEDYARLEVGEERLRLALDAAHMGVWDWNLATGDIKPSRSLEAIFGLPPGGFGGTYASFEELVHPDDRGRVNAALATAVEQGTGYEAEYRTMWADGSVHWIAARGQFLRDASGRPVRMLGVGTDVTTRKQLEEKLRDHAGRLAEADQRKDEFLAMLAHELRNPLAPVLHALELLRLAGGDPADVERARAVLDRQIRHLVRLVEDLLDISRITWGKIALRTERVELVRIVASAEEIARPQLEMRRHRLTIALPPEPVWLDADATRLAEVLANLLDNAAKYTPEGGSVWLTAERALTQVVIRVRDTGSGMSPQVLARAFDLFAQGEPTLDRPHGGLGIGLTLVRRLVELHGGRVAAASDGPGLGTEVTLWLPVAAEPAASRPEPLPAAAPRGEPRRLLVVDDNLDAAESLALLLAAQGHEVRRAHSGPEALAVARDFVPEVILLDIGLPGMDGYEVARSVRGDRALRHCQVIAVTGYGRDEDRRRSREAGFDHHLVKPVTLAALKAVLALPPRGAEAPPPADAEPMSHADPMERAAASSPKPA
jgi:two-component system CheB/CheR fusion protein